MKKRTIRIKGCDDKTIIKLKLTREEAQLIAKISAMSIEESDYDCMPTIHLDK